jgi:acyl dehydratase
VIEVDRPADMQRYVGQKLGTSDWLTVDQEKIDASARLTRDDNWIHVYVERTRRELPDGKTIAHGLLTLSLMPYLAAQTLKIRRRSRSINYGSNKIRFPAPVKSGARLRLHRTLEKFEPVDGGARLTFSNIIEIEGEERPAMAAESISVVYESAARSSSTAVASISSSACSSTSRST